MASNRQKHNPPSAKNLPATVLWRMDRSAVQATRGYESLLHGDVSPRGHSTRAPPSRSCALGACDVQVDASAAQKLQLFVTNSEANMTIGSEAGIKRIAEDFFASIGRSLCAIHEVFIFGKFDLREYTLWKPSNHARSGQYFFRSAEKNR
jgi:hypothetical protein